MKAPSQTGDGRRRLPLQVRLTALMGAVVSLALLLSIATVLNRQYKAMEQMAPTSGTTIASFVANNVALRTVENAGLPPAEQDWPPVQRFVAAASRDLGSAKLVADPAASCADRVMRPPRPPLSSRR